MSTSVGPQYASTSQSVSGTWASLANAAGSTSGDYTVWTHSARNDSGTWQGAGFDFSSVPSGAVISNVLAEVQHHESATNTISTVTGQFYINGTAVGSSTTLTKATTDVISSWSVTSGIAPSDLANLQVRVTATGPSNTTQGTFNLDWARVTVTYDVPGSTGSGDVGVKKAVVSGAGTYVESYTGSGSGSLKKLAVAGSGVYTPVTFTGSGGVAAKKPVPAGNGSTALPGLNGLGGVSLKKPAVSGSGSETFTGSGAAIGHKPSVAGAGTVSGAPVTGSGGITRRKPSVAGNGSLGFTGAGGVTRLKALLSGSGTVAVPVTGSGSARAKKLLVSGTGSYSTTRPPLALGGSAQTVTYGGSVTRIDPALAGTGLVAAYGGSKTQVSFGGTLTHVTAAYTGVLALPTFGGSLSTISFGGSLIGWSMQTQDITLMEHNDETLDVTITKNGSALNLTGYTIEAYLKATSATADADATTEKLSTTTGEITITNAATGQAEIAIPAVDLADTTHTFWRLDVVNAGKRNTVFSGKVTVTPL